MVLEYTLLKGNHVDKEEVISWCRKTALRAKLTRCVCNCRALWAPSSGQQLYRLVVSPTG